MKWDMNRILFYTLIFTIVSCLVGACDGDQVQEPSKAVELSVSPSSQVVAALGEQKVFSVVSATDWYARSSEKWAKVITATGKASGTGVSLMVIFEENKTEQIRTASITVGNLGKESVVVSISQEASDGVQIERGIATAEDLVGFAKAINGEGSISRYMVDGVIKFVRDIDASSITEWIPAGTSQMPLIYNIDGNNCTIRNVNWKVNLQKSPYAGLVGCAKGVIIENLTFGDEGSQIELVGVPSSPTYVGGIVGYSENTTIRRSTNNVSLKFVQSSDYPCDVVAGGIAGMTDGSCVIGGDIANQGCINGGNISAEVPIYIGGLAGYNNGVIRNCINRGTVSCPSDGEKGAGWLCSYNFSKVGVTLNTGYGNVGTVPSMMKNSMVNYEDGYDFEANTVDWTSDAYYDWDEKATVQLHAGLTYHMYDCRNVPRKIHVLETDLTNPNIEIACAYAGEIVPNPNANGNHNNGFNLRETLSMLCDRRCEEGQKILAGTNGGFFDSHDGISRGFHVVDGEPAYINNPKVVQALTTQAYALTVFTDRTASIGLRKFTGKLRLDGNEYSFQTINDTTLRHPSPDIAPINLFNWRYVRSPYPSRPDIINELSDDALYVICRYTSDVLKVNTGYAQAEVIDILDGRSSIIKLPYITDKDRVGIALSGTVASEWAEKVKKGDIVEIKCEIAIDGDASKPIYTQISSKYQYMVFGLDNNSSSLDTEQYSPLTFAVLSEDYKKVWLVSVDGRQDWYSIGVKGYELYRIAKKLGGAWATRFDGGGSTTMWLWDKSQGKGNVVNSISERGERSCLSYILIREK